MHGTKPFKQLYYIIAGKKGEQVRPAVYILMQKRTEAAYKEAFNQLKEIAASYNLVLNPLIALTDFEKAVRKALKFHFPGIKLKGCFFHFKQAIGRWIFKNGYKKTFMTNIAFKFWFRKLSSLAVIPLDQVQDAYDMIKKQADSIGLYLFLNN